MNTIDKLRAEIERRMKEDYNSGDEDIDSVAQGVCAGILSFLDTLEPVSDNLEEEVKRYYSENFSYITSDQPTLSILTNIARHFAEWQKAKMMEGAVEGKVIVLIYDEGDIWSTEIEIPGRYEPSGSKVKIIVVNEEEQ